MTKSQYDKLVIKINERVLELNELIMRTIDDEATSLELTDDTGRVSFRMRVVNSLFLRVYEPALIKAVENVPEKPPQKRP